MGRRRTRLGLFGGCGTFIWLSLTSSIAFGRYLTSAVIFGAILAGRLVGRLVERSSNGWQKPALAIAAVLVLSGCTTSFVESVTAPAPVQPVTQLARYLEQHHLKRGIGDYWSASIVTVVSNDAVVVRPVSTLQGGLEIGRYLSQSSSTWYGGGFQFLVYNAVCPGMMSRVGQLWRRSVPARHVAVVGRWRVLTFAHDLTIRTDGSYAPQPWATRSQTG